MTDYTDLVIEREHSDFTVQLGHLLTYGFDSDETLHLDAAHYAIYDESYRPTLNHKIVAHFALREIGQETGEQFAFMLGRKMNEIMPVYNKLYESLQIKFDPMLTQDVNTVVDNTSTSQSSGKSTVNVDGTTDSKGTTDTTTSGDGMAVHAEFPQTRIDDFDRFATSADKSSSASTSHVDSDQSSTTHQDTQSANDFTSESGKGNNTAHSSGFSGISGSALIVQYRQSLINVDQMIFTELEPLFMQVWGTSTPMSRQRYADDFGAYGDYHM